jgi:hypothetical protein
MRSLQIRYFLIALVAVAVGASVLAGWGNFLIAGFVGILAGRAAVKNIFDLNTGKAAGIAMGIWAGAGAFLGSILAAIFARAMGVSVALGITLLLAFVSLALALFASSVAARESVKLPDEEA